MKIIGRYVLKEHVGPFLFASAALTSLMLLQYIAKRFGDLVGKGLPWSVIGKFMGLSVPFTVAMTMPMAVLVAVLYAFSRLAAENEITALKASGVSMRSVLVPVLLGGIAMSAVMVFFNDQVLPRANHSLAVLQMDIFRTKPTFALREQVINEVKSGQLYLRAGEIDPGTSRMKDVVIHDMSNPARPRTIYADSGQLALAPNRTDLDMTLYDGEMHEVPNDKNEQLSRMFFKRDRLRVRGVLSSYRESETGTVMKGDREMSVCEMHRAMARADYEKRYAEYEMALVEHEWRGRKKPTPPGGERPLSIGKLYCDMLSLPRVREAQAQSRNPAADTILRPRPNPERARRMVGEPEEVFEARLREAQFRRDDARRERNRYDVEIHKKFSLAAACIIFVLIGAPIAVRFPRGGVGLVIGVSFAIFGLYYVGLIGGETLADKGFVQPWLAMWGANLILFVAGLVLSARMGRESTTTRGGDFAELMAALRIRAGGVLRAMGIAVERRRRP